MCLIGTAHLGAEGTAEQAAQVVGQGLRLARLCRVDHGDLGPGGHCPSHERGCKEHSPGQEQSHTTFNGATLIHVDSQTSQERLSLSMVFFGRSFRS